MAIKRNAVKCLLCGVIIESKSRHDLRWCNCGNVAVDGGLDYLKRLFHSESFEELSEEAE